MFPASSGSRSSRVASGSGRCTGFTGGHFAVERKATAEMQIWVSVCRKGGRKLTVVTIAGADYKSMFFKLLSFHFLGSVSVRTLWITVHCLCKRRNHLFYQHKRSIFWLLKALRRPYAISFLGTKVSFLGMVVNRTLPVSGISGYGNGVEN